MAPAFDGKVIQQGDTLKWKAMAKEQHDFHDKTGEYTTWTSSMFSGMPSYHVTSPPSKSVFSKIQNFLNLYLFGLNGSVGIVFLYLLGFYVALLAIGVSPWLSLLGALAFGLGSYNIIIIEAGHITKAYAMAMMAPILGGMLLILRRKKYLWGGLLFALALGLQIACNHIQITYYTMLTGLVLGAVYLVYAIKDKELKSLLCGVGVMLIGCAFAIGANARLLFINQEYVKYTMRGGSEITVTPEDLYKDGEPKSIAASNGLDKDYAFAWSYGKGETYTLLVPGACGGGSGETVGTDSEFYKNFRQKQAPLYWGDQPFTSGPVYLGAIVCLLFVLGLFIVKGPYKWALLAATLFSVLLAWGHHFMPLTELFFKYFPMYNKFRAVESILIVDRKSVV